MANLYLSLCNPKLMYPTLHTLTLSHEEELLKLAYQSACDQLLFGDINQQWTLWWLLVLLSWQSFGFLAKLF